MEVNLKSLQSIPKSGEASHVQGTFTFRWSIGGGIDNLNINEPNIQTIIGSKEPENLKYEFVSKAIFYDYNETQLIVLRSYLG